MTAQRRTALLSVFAAVALIALKLTTGLLTHSLGLLSEAAHSGTDLVAALLMFFAVASPASRRFPVINTAMARRSTWLPSERARSSSLRAWRSCGARSCG